MVRFFRHENRFKVVQVRDWLSAHGVPCYLNNEYAIGAAGDLSPFDCWPEVWLDDASWVPRADQLLSELDSRKRADWEWQCRECGETNGGSFELCWHCGEEQPD